MHMMPRHYLGLLMVVKATSRKSNFIHMEDVYTFKKNCGDEANNFNFVIFTSTGFLPEEWDKFFVKYLYPSFTPTVFLFVAGTVAYGVLKYLQNEGIKTPK
ncbi:Protein LOW PSII accumulation 2, chloroplastic [Vitis vinifera]|uniref:Protein LOW PSII accumulation 2, chloroplastic n=1 Tax=Vitis vinifera TaxID=29760 RepID=A0A438DIC7_VITVI|nr:Protein LOW PSII accumulation 2, chloroplastic [Vitis vinifera]